MRAFAAPGEAVRYTGVLAALLAMGVAAACGSAERQRSVAEAPPSAESHVPLRHTFESPEILARELLGAIERKDRARLEELALTEDEFKTIVWPRLPSSRPEAGLPVDYAWQDLHSKSVGYLITTLHEFGGQRLELIGLEFRGETTDYVRFQVRRRSTLDVRDESGNTRRVRLFGSMIEQDGRVKVFSYVVD
jgi:hypothetical protein